jgi:hypothetical protein
MAPNFVVGPYSSHQKDLHSAETVDSVQKGPFDAVPGAPVRRQINETGHPPLNSSSMANAGSQDSDIAAPDELPWAGEGLVAPSNSPTGEMTEIGESQDILRRNYGHVSLPALFHSFPTKLTP